MPRLQTYQEVNTQLTAAIPDACRSCIDAQILASVRSGEVVLENAVLADQRREVGRCIAALRGLDCQGDPVSGEGCRASAIMTRGHEAPDAAGQQQAV
jgi:hypothetical protein